MRLGIVAVLVVALVAGGVGSYYYFFPTSVVVDANAELAAAAVSSSTLPQDTSRSVPDGAKEYRNDRYHFSLLYPAEMTVQEVPGNANTIAIAIQETSTQQGFQIFIVPNMTPQ